MTMQMYTAVIWSATHLFQIIETGEILAHNAEYDQYLDYKHRMWTQTNKNNTYYYKVKKPPCTLLGNPSIRLVSIYALKIVI